MSKAVLELLKHKGESGVPLIYLTYSSLCVHPSLGTADVLQACIGSPNVKAMQSMMFIKGPGKRGQATHQVKARWLAGVLRSYYCLLSPG